MLIEEMHVVPQVLAIWSTIVAFPDLYYDFRGQFISMNVGSLARLGLAGSATSDSRSLSLDMVELIIKWERMRIAKDAESGMRIDSDDV